ncbi:hypothetical protein MHA_2551 [Mannheimia haemolytica PHL213]|nr:hypothetical protein MHA_2551 [Mannheimia haemolytica PHL213]
MLSHFDINDMINSIQKSAFFDKFTSANNTAPIIKT